MKIIAASTRVSNDLIWVLPIPYPQVVLSRLNGQRSRVGRVSGRVRSGRVGSKFCPYLVSQVGSNCVGLCGWPCMMQNFMLNVIVKFTYSDLLLLMCEFRCTSCLHRK